MFEGYNGRNDPHEDNTAEMPLSVGAKRRALIVLTIAAVLLAAGISSLMNRNKKSPEDTDVPTVSAADPETVETEQQPEDDPYTKLYIVDDNTPVWEYPGEGAPVGEVSDGYISGMFTGEGSAEHRDMIMIDRFGGKALVYSTHAIPVDSAKVLPLGALSQFDGYGGESACGAAVLTMLFGGDLTELINFSDSNGYSDQGSLYSYTGGMTFEAMQQLAEDRFSARLVNCLTDSEAPSDTIKRLIDEGRYVIATVSFNTQVVVGYGVTHFILINGYMEYDGHTEFIYANSYNQSGGGISLDHISAELLESSMLSELGETACLAYAEEIG